MNEHLRDRILRRVETLSDERGYQVLDYVEFLDSKYAERQTPQGNAFTRFTEAVEDRLRAGRVSAAAIAETMGLLNRAANVLNGAVAAGRSVASDLVSAAQTASSRPGSGTTAAPGQSGQPGTTTPAPRPAESSPPPDVKPQADGQDRM
jgi:hypothetical protein